MFGCVMCKVDILLWSDRGIASYALTLRRPGARAEEGADGLPSLHSAPRQHRYFRLSAYHRSRFHLGCRTRPGRSACACASASCLLNLNQHGITYAAFSFLVHLVSKHVGRSMWALKCGSEPGQTLIG